MAASKEKNTGMAVVAYILFFVPLLTDAKDDPFVKFHVKQGLVLLLAAVANWVASFILVWIPIIGWLAMGVFSIGLLVLWIMGILNALQGEKKELPLIGSYASKFNL